MAFKQWLITGLLTASAATAVWAVVGEDSIYQNTVVDKQVAVGAKGRLISADNRPLGNREAWIFVHGLQFKHQDEHGISVAAAKKLFAGCTTNFPFLYQEVRANEKLESRVKTYFFTYDSTRDVLDIGADLDALIEGNSELTRAGVRIVCLSHSKGGNVVQAYQYHSRGRKLVRSVTLASPHRGSQLADPDAVQSAFRKLYPTVGGVLANLAESRVDFSSPGMQWLCPDNPGLMRLHGLSPLDDRWILYGGTVKPHTGGVWKLVELVDALLLKNDSSEVSDHWSPIGAALIRASGDDSGSDGLVSLDSAWAVGLAEDVQTRLMFDYNHHEILHGKGGELDLYRQILWDLVTFPPLENPEPAFGDLDFQLPSLDLFELSESERTDFGKSNRVWIADKQVFVSADEMEEGNINPASRRLNLGQGEFSWPAWYHGHILVTRKLAGQSNIILVQSDGRVLQLTTDGKSQLASPDETGRRIVYISDGRLLIRSPSGMTRIVISDKLDLDAPPVIWGNKIYFAHRSPAGEYDIYWVSASAQHYRLSQASRVAESVRSLARFESRWGNLLVGIRTSGNNPGLVVLLDDKWGIGRRVLNLALADLNQYLHELGLLFDCQVAMDSTSNYLYLVHNGEIRQLDTVQLVAKVRSWSDQFISGDEMTISPADIDDFLPVIGTGTQLDVK